MQHIALRDSDRGPRACVARTGFKVRVVVELHLGAGLSIEEIEQQYRLTPSEIHAALSYYYDHQEEIDEEMRDLTVMVTD